MSGPTLNIAVNLTWLAPGRVGGSEEYLVRQLTGIAQGAGGAGLRLHLLCQPRFIDEHPWLTSQIPTTPMPINRDLRGARVIAENSWLPAIARGSDVIHNGGGTAPILNPGAMVLTIHDLQYLRFPHYFSRARRAWLHSMMPRSVRAADVIAVPSAYVRDRVLEEFVAPGQGVNDDTVRVVRHGLPPIAIPTPDEVADARLRHRIQGPYIAYAAITHRHKAHDLLVDMLATTRSPDHPLHRYQLVLIGGVGSAEPDLLRAIASSGVADRIVRTGRVSRADRDALIAGAEVLAFPSRYEGFGAPLVEAMALDTPVVASDHPAVAEVVGDAGVIVASRDPGEWADAIAAVAAAPESLITSGRIRRERFTIEQSGAELGAVYRLAAERGGERR